jgi:polar amino acid transport system substrate-binding protein
MKLSTTAKAWRKPLLTLLAFAVVLSFCVQLATSYSAEALTVTTTTAKSNQASGNSVVGGQPTRVTWEAKVDEGEAVSAVTLTFPAGSSFADNANVQATILYQEDPRRAAQRIEVEQSYELDGESVVITFGELIETDYVIRVEIHNVALPALGGDYVVNGSYVDENGAIQTLADSPSITVIGTTLVDRIVTWLNGQKWVESWNSVLFLRIFFNPQLIVAAFPNLFFGWLRSLGLVLLGFPLAIPFGLGFAFLRMSRFGILRFLASIYVNVIRGTPLFLQMYIVIIGIQIAGASFNSYFLGVIVLAVNSSAYLAEIFRAGIQSIHKGQFEASASLGMNGVQTMFSVIIPQTVRRVIPTATSEFILLYKDTALLAAVGVMEMMMFAKSMAAVSGNMTPYVVAACYYLVVTLPLTKVIANFEKKLAAADGTTSEPPAKKKKRNAKKAQETKKEGGE